MTQDHCNRESMIIGLNMGSNFKTPFALAKTRQHALLGSC